VENDNLKWHK